MHQYAPPHIGQTRSKIPNGTPLPTVKPLPLNANGDTENAARMAMHKPASHTRNENTGSGTNRNHSAEWLGLSH